MMKHISVFTSLKEILKLYFFKSVKAYKEGGILKIFKNIVNICFETNSADWYEKDLTSEIPSIKASVPVEIEFNNMDELINWLNRDDRNWMIVPQEIELAREQGHYFATAKVDGNIVGCMKICFGRVYIMDYKKVIKFPEKVFFTTDLYILPEFRGRKLGITEYFINQMLLFMKEKGFTKCRTHIPSWNFSSRWLIYKCRFKKVREIRFIRIFKIKFLLASPAAIKNV
jgi:GNAT superfamily N-acetyltransferase